MFRALIGLVAASVAVTTMGCGVSAEKYARDVDTLKEHNAALERMLAEAAPIVEAYKHLTESQVFVKSQEEMYAEIARELAEALKGFKNADNDVVIDAKTGKVTFATDVLFESGSFTITPKGQEILKKFAATVKSQNVKFRVIGHTDSAKIAKDKTKAALTTDSNPELSVLRAVAVMGALMKLDIKDSRFIEVIGMGASRPAATAAKSRRVEIFLVKDDVKHSSAGK